MDEETLNGLGDDELRLIRMFRCLGAADQQGLMVRVGRMLLLAHPPEPGEPDAKPQELDSGQWEWIDDQLNWVCPFEGNLVSLGDALRTTFCSAWPEGFDSVVLGLSENDSSQAKELVAAYLEQALELDLPLMIDFGASEEEMEATLRAEFMKFIREWREVVLRKVDRSTCEEVKA